jgi:hypothetical protein
VTDEYQPIPQGKRTPTGGDGVYVNIHAEEANTIQSIKFSEMSSIDNLSCLITTPIHLHDNHAKKFHIKQSSNTIAEVYRLISDLTSTMVHDPEFNTISMNISTTRKTNTNIKHVYNTTNSSESANILNQGVNSSVFSGVMLSNTVEFTTPGQPWRQSGRFISIEPSSDSSDNLKSVYHNKVYGQYLVLSIIHRWNDEYTNKTIGVKPNTHQPINFTSADNSSPEIYSTFNAR